MRSSLRLRLRLSLTRQHGSSLGLWQREHGGGGSTGKTSTWEGGHREPSLAVWPGRIAAGATSHALDLTSSLAGLPLPAGRTYDGIDLAPVLFGAAGAARAAAGGAARAAARAAARGDAVAHPAPGEGPMGEQDTVRVGRCTPKIQPSPSARPLVLARTLTLRPPAPVMPGELQVKLQVPHGRHRLGMLHGASADVSLTLTLTARFSSVR